MGGPDEAPVVRRPRPPITSSGQRATADDVTAGSSGARGARAPGSSSWGGGTSTTTRTTAMPSRPTRATELYRDLAISRAARLRGGEADSGNRRLRCPPRARTSPAWVLANARGIKGILRNDTPLTLAAWRRAAAAYLRRSGAALRHLPLVPGGPDARSERASASAPRRARALCMLGSTPAEYRQSPCRDAGTSANLGNLRRGSQPGSGRLLLDPARRLAAGRLSCGAAVPATIRLAPLTSSASSTDRPRARTARSTATRD